MSRTYQKLPFFSALLPCRGWHVPRRRQPSPVPHTSLISSSSCCVLLPQLRTRHSSRYYCLSMVTVRWLMQGVFPGADEGCTFGSRCRLSVRRNMLGVLPGIYAGCHFGVSSGCPFGSRCRGHLPGAAAGSPSSGRCSSVLSGADEGSPSEAATGCPSDGR